MGRGCDRINETLTEPSNILVIVAARPGRCPPTISIEASVLSAGRLSARGTSPLSTLNDHSPPWRTEDVPECLQNVLGRKVRFPVGSGIKGVSCPRIGRLPFREVACRIHEGAQKMHVQHRCKFRARPDQLFTKMPGQANIRRPCR